MKDIRISFQGRVAADAEMKTSKAGNLYLQVGVFVETGEKTADQKHAPAEYVRCTHVARKDAPDDYIFGVAERLKKGGEVYVEGSLTARPWLDKEGKPKAGLQVFAWICQPMGQLRRPERHQDDQGRPAQGGMELPPDEPKSASGPADTGFSDDSIPFQQRESW